MYISLSRSTRLCLGLASWKKGEIKELYYILTHSAGKIWLSTISFYFVYSRSRTQTTGRLLLQSPIPPDYVFWFHNDMLLNFQPKRDGVKVETDYGSRTHSKLEIKDANESDTGNYTCSTSSGKPYSIYVQVLAGIV